MEPIIVAPYIPGHVALATVPPPPQTSSSPQPLMNLRQSALEGPRTALERYVAALLVCDHAVTTTGVQQVQFGATCHLVGNERVEGQGLGCELFLTLQALVAAYAHQGRAHLKTGEFTKAMTTFTQAAQLLEAGTGIYARHRAVLPLALRESHTMNVDAQHARAQLLFGVARQASLAMLVTKEQMQWRDLLPCVAGLVQAYATLADTLHAQEHGDLERVTRAQSELWTARAAAILADSSSADTARLWHVVQAAAERAGTLHQELDAAAASLMHMADAALVRQSAENLAQPVGGALDSVGGPLPPQSMAELMAAFVPEVIALDAVPSIVDHLWALGDAWMAQHQLQQQQQTAERAPVPVATDERLEGTALLARLLHVDTNHALLRHPLMALFETVALRAAIVERERRVRLGNDTREHATLHVLLAQSARALDDMVKSPIKTNL